MIPSNNGLVNFEQLASFDVSALARVDLRRVAPHRSFAILLVLDELDRFAHLAGLGLRELLRDDERRCRLLGVISRE